MKSYPRFIIRHSIADDWEIIEQKTQLTMHACNTRRAARELCRQMNEAKVDHEQNRGGLR